MIAHISLPARDPRATARLLATLIDGEVFPFPVVSGAWITVASDGSGLAFEVYPDGMAHHPGTGQPDPAIVPAGSQTLPWEDQIHMNGEQLHPTAFHVALTTSLSDEQVLGLARQAGVRAVPCDRAGLFKLIELWLDDVVLVEVLNRSESLRYTQFMNPVGCEGVFGKGERPALSL